MATNGSFDQQDQYKSAPEQYTATTGAENATNNTNGNDLSKDEIGWYFVEQYYTTLSRSPEKLHLFYGKRSQFVSGQETEVSAVSYGRSAIQERIKALDFQDCKVRVSNVDSQASDENIVIQVIGETSNKGAEPKKFVQTFVLAQQPTGYFVLNDIFRYIKEEVEDEPESSAAPEEAHTAIDPEHQTEVVEMPQPQEAAEDKGPLDADVVDKKLEETVAAVSTEEPTTNGTEAEAVEDVPEVEEVTEAPATNDALSAEEAIKVVDEEDTKETEKPQDPVPSPAMTRLPSATKAPMQQASTAAPMKPMSWANRAAAAAAASAPKPAVPQAAKVATPATPTPAAPRAQPVAPAPLPAAQAPPAPAKDTKENESQPQGSEWQTAGADNAKRQNRPQSVSGPLEKEGTMGYVRNVIEAVKNEELRSALSKYGELVYFDVNRQKNCAFVEFASPAGYQAAAAANPHIVGGEEILVEPRRPKSSAYGGSGYTGRGGMSQRGRGGFENRQGNQRGRGDFANRGRGGARGRGGNASATPV